MYATTACIALVGCGKGGEALLSDIIKMPGILVKYVCDINKNAEGVKLAKNNNIPFCSWDDVDKILSDKEIDLILEVTGKQEVFDFLSKNKSPSINIIGSNTSKIIFHFLDAQQNVTRELEKYKEKLEEKIIERTEEIENANTQLQKKVYEFEQLNEKLQQINDTKTKYLLQSTHQLKAPFASIQSYTDILLQGYAGQISETANEIIEKIKARCDLLSTSIKNMLELANLNSCIEDNIKMQNINLGSILPSIIDSFASILEKKNITITYDDYATNDVVKCNKEQITIAINNIINNAISYSNNESSIEIHIKNLDTGETAIDITDHGIGIPEANITKIFSEYFRSNNAAKKYDKGTGLGLSIVKRIADIHKCKIDIKSKLYEGTTVTIIFPIFSGRCLQD